MKNLIITDVHEENPFPLIERARAKGIERVIFLGDIEHPRLLRDLHRLKNRIIVLGNHEYSYSDDNIPISGDTEDQDKYARLWKIYQDEKRRCVNFFENKNLSNENDGGCVVVKNMFEKRVCFLHGLLVGGVYLEHPFIGGRLLADREHKVKRENLREMKKQNIDILFRGHDHQSYISSSASEEIDETDFPVHLETGSFGTRLAFSPERKYIVSVGKFKDEHCVILDDSSGEILFQHTYSL
jgi:predicted phosphodiesterase